MKNWFSKTKLWFSTEFREPARRYQVLLVGLVLASVFAVKLSVLLQSPYANGWDGYYYLEQIKSLLEKGHLHSKDSALIYPYLAIIKFFTADYVLAYKIASALLAVLFILSVFILALKISGRFWPALLVVSLLAYSPFLTYFAAQFPKNLMGLMFFNLLVFALLAQSRAYTVVFFAGCFLSHRMSAAFALLFLLLFLAFEWKYKYKKHLLIGLAALSALLALLPGTLHLYDLERLKQGFSLMPQFAPLSFVQLQGVGNLSWFMLDEMLLATLLFLSGVVFFIVKLKATGQRTFWFSLLLLLLITVFPFFTFEVNGAGVRFFFVFMLTVPLLALLFTDLLHNKIMAGLILLAVGLSIPAGFSYKAQQFDPPYGLYAKIIGKAEPFIKAHDKNIDLIVAHKSLAEMLSYVTGKDCMSYKPENTYNPERVYRIARGFLQQDYRRVLGDADADNLVMLSLDIFIIREDRYAEFVKKAAQLNESGLVKITESWENPGKERPKFLLKGR